MQKKPDTSTPTRKRGSGVQHVYDILQSEILNLELAPGCPIDEFQLSKRFEMSRTPIREALVRLASEGLVTILPNRATVVTNIDFLSINAFLEATTLMYRVTTRLAAQHRSDSDLEAIRRHQCVFVEAVKARDAPAIIKANMQFHAAIARAGGNPYFENLLLRLLNEGRRILRPYYSSFGDKLPEAYVIEHEDIIAAIAAQNIEEADRVSNAHADQIVKRVQDLFAKDQRQDIPL